MKKALALVLALVLALSMAVSAFGAVSENGLVILTPTEKNPEGKDVIDVVPAVDEAQVLYATKAGTYYIALDDADYKDVAVSANGIISAELVKFDPEKMEIPALNIVYEITCKGEGTNEFLPYEDAKVAAKDYNDAAKVTYYGYKLATHVNVIKVTVAENYSAAYKEGTLKITATLDKKAVSATLTVINDVTIFEYENVKWAANTKDAVLACGELGYSDYFTAENGYGEDYVPSDLRDRADAAVVSTTAFRAIAGKDLTVECKKLAVTLKAIAAGQKGVNFKHEDVAAKDYNKDGVTDAIAFAFLGDQVIAGDYTITADLGYTWYTLREEFGVKVEEDDIISYYVLKNGKVVSEIKVDYMTADIDEEVVLTLNGSNSTLGAYEVVLEVPAVEGETNPNTGAESVVGVVAALAVVSVATAAAVSLKK